MIFVWFIYGLAFFVLGLVITVYPKKGSAFKLARDIWLIACFGFLHGINEWLDMFIEIGEPFPPDILKIIRMVTLVGSFLFLIRFGTKVIAEIQKKYKIIQVLPVVLLLIWVIIFIISEQRFLTGDISARYLLCVPGTLLTALALFLQAPQFKGTKRQMVVANLRLAALTFLLYGILAGLVVKKASFFGPNFLNADVFKSVFGAPVQIFRAVCAIVMACSTTYVLSIFRWETKESLRRSEERCSTIAAIALIIVFVQDRNSVITFIQGKGLKNLGLKSEEIVGRNISDYFQSVPQLARDSSRALSGEEFVSNIKIGEFIFKFCYSPLRDNEGEVIGTIGVALDITSKVEAEQELDNYRRQIEKNARLAEIGTMSSMIAQQVEEPLAVTRLLLQRITDDLGSVCTPEAVTDSLKKSFSEISKASDIINKFRNITDLPVTNIASPIDVYQIAKRLIAVFAESAKLVNLTISLKDMEFVLLMRISPRELEHLFFILIQNAIDAANAEKSQKLTINCTVDKKHIELRFADTCGGIEEERLGDIFTPFSVASQNERKTGLGLAIAKQIVDTHGGQISAQSKAGQGTTFYVKLPIEQVY